MRHQMTKLAMRMACALITRRYHGILTGQARAILRTIERASGRLDPALVRQCDAYAHDALGATVYAPWLYVYTALAGEFKEGWIPDNYYGYVVVPRLKGAYGTVSNRKALTSHVFGSDAFPDVAYRVNGVSYDTRGEPVPSNRLARHVFKHGDVAVFKAEGSSQGRSVLLLRAASFDHAAVERLGNGVFQAYVTQHPFFADFMPTSVATLRITTVVTDSGAPAARACYLRLARAADTHVQSSSHVRVAVDLSSGQLDDHGFLASWSSIDHHPDSGRRFAGATIPHFQDCIETVIDLHQRFPYPRVIGWDVIVDSDAAVKILEWNGEHNDVKFSEATQGPCFADLGWERLWKIPAPVTGEWVAALRTGVC